MFIEEYQHCFQTFSLFQNFTQLFKIVEAGVRFAHSAISSSKFSCLLPLVSQ